MAYTRTAIAGLLIGGLTLGLSAPLQAAQDFSQYQTGELIQMRDQARYWDQVDADAFRSEMQGRMQSLTPDERSALRAEAGTGQGRGMGQGSGQGQGNGQGQRLRDGSGSGGGYGRGGATADASGAGGGYGPRGGGGGRGH